MTNFKERVQWIDVAKFIAVLAVMTDHTDTILYLYSRRSIVYGTYFSVSLFILLLGITSFWSLKNRKITCKKWIFKRSMEVFVPYLIASAVSIVYFEGFFDFQAYIEGIINFNIIGAFYYVLLYLQLVIIAPLLYQIFSFSVDNKYGWCIELTGCLFVLIISYLTTNYTNILSVYGGGGKVFGGSYLFLFYIGMWIGKYHEKLKLKKWQAPILFVAGLTGSLLWWRFIVTNQFQLDKKLMFGAGINPPSISLFVYTLLIAITIYALVSFVSEFENSIPAQFFTWVAKLGKHTLYIFLYHGLVIEILEDILGASEGMLTENVWLKRIIYFPCMILGSLLAEFIVLKVSKWLKKVYNT